MVALARRFSNQKEYIKMVRWLILTSSRARHPFSSHRQKKEHTDVVVDDTPLAVVAVHVVLKKRKYTIQ